MKNTNLTLTADELPVWDQSLPRDAERLKLPLGKSHHPGSKMIPTVISGVRQWWRRGGGRKNPHCLGPIRTSLQENPIPSTVRRDSAFSQRWIPPSITEGINTIHKTPLRSDLLPSFPLFSCISSSHPRLRPGTSPWRQQQTHCWHSQSRAQSATRRLFLFSQQLFEWK